MMSQPIHIKKALLEAFVDGELTAHERKQVEAHLSECEECGGFYHQYKEERALLQMTLQQDTARVSDEIDWAAFEAQVMRRVAPLVPTPIATPPTPSIRWTRRLFSWLKAHPGWLLASGATVGILLLFSVPYLDPGPSDKDANVIVERVTKSKTARVSVLQSKVQGTNSPMTVIVVREPPAEPSATHPSRRAPQPERHTPQPRERKK